MTFQKAFPTGLTNDVNTITAAQAETLDDNQSNSLDMAQGGTYAPANPITVNGAGIGSDNLQTSVMGSGQTLTRDPGGHYPKRIDATTIIDSGSVQILDFTFDTYWTNLTQTQALTLRLATSTGNTPISSDIIEVTRVGTGGGFIIDIESEDNPGSPIATIPAAYANQVAGSPFFARFYFNGTTWVPLRFSADVSP